MAFFIEPLSNHLIACKYEPSLQTDMTAVGFYDHQRRGAWTTRWPLRSRQTATIVWPLDFKCIARVNAKFGRDLNRMLDVDKQSFAISSFGQPGNFSTVWGNATKK